MSYNPPARIPKEASMRLVRVLAMLVVASPVVLSAQTSPLTAEQRAQFHGPYSQPEEPFRLIGNIYYVGAKNIASYLITTPQGHILVDTGTTEMTPVITANVQKLGFKLRDIKIMLSSHAHFDHIGGHAAMKKATGAQVMAMRLDAEALEAGMDKSPLGDEGWTPVKVDRVLADGDTVTLGGTTLRAVWAPGHTPGCTVWTTPVQDAGKTYSFAIFGCGGPNAGVKLIGNQRFPRLVDETLATFRKLKMLEPDIYVTGHPQMLFTGKIGRMKAGERPHPLLDPGAQAWKKMLDDAEANFTKRVEAERAASSR
jgi:metallo-beta-lactamase class B